MFLCVIRGIGLAYDPNDFGKNRKAPVGAGWSLELVQVVPPGAPDWVSIEYVLLLPQLGKGNASPLDLGCAKCDRNDGLGQGPKEGADRSPCKDVHYPPVHSTTTQRSNVRATLARRYHSRRL